MNITESHSRWALRCLAGVALALILLVAGCGSSSDDTPSDDAPGTTAPVDDSLTPDTGSE